MTITKKLKQISDYGYYILCLSLGILVGGTSWWVLPFSFALMVVIATMQIRLNNLEYKNEQLRK